MGMVMVLRAASDDHLFVLFADPEIVNDFLFSGDADDQGSIDLDKAWHGLHFLLSGDPNLDIDPADAKPEAFLIAGGTPIGDIDVGYGPARGLTSREVKDVDAALQRFTTDTLREAFDPEKFAAADIYPNIWDRKDPEDLEYLIENFESLKKAVGGAARDGLGLIVYLT